MDIVEERDRETRTKAYVEELTQSERLRLQLRSAEQSSARARDANNKA